ncbi:MAG: citryl-CoA lyase [Candidatus Andersenbacteria bacterium]|nr:citryl-CoA lyase [Candidatus Andersenbacteria bacterium]
MQNVPWTSDITEVLQGRLVTYGVDQEEILRSYSYEEMVFLLLFGRKPNPVEAVMLRSVIVSHCSHGISGQSTLAVRMGVDCGSPFLNSTLAGFLVGSGPYHQGGLEAAMKELIGLGEQPDLGAYVRERLQQKNRLIGFGHRFHKHDPRARILMDLCNEHAFGGKYLQIAQQTDKLLFAEKNIHMNIEAAGGAILLDLGFPVEIASLIILIGRGPMLAAAYMERLRSGNKPFQKISVSDVL